MYGWKREHPTGNKWIDSLGYVGMVVGGKPIREHRYVMEQKIGRKLARREYVHHINGDKQDNREENLVITMASEHIPKEHADVYERLTTRQEVSCGICGKKFMVIPQQLRVGRGKWCSRECYYASKRRQEGNEVG